ncbi:hypothetical protein SDC9_82810 [bioreactor metagenome]|uniref:Uncharacterized protein n=1 Tax=bioreactor metagenome TaxID=1076179 RepID=A0A644Z5M6_9ZZZZ
MGGGGAGIQFSVFADVIGALGGPFQGRDGAQKIGIDSGHLPAASFI